MYITPLDVIKTYDTNLTQIGIDGTYDGFVSIFLKHVCDNKVLPLTRVKYLKDAYLQSLL